MASRIANIEVGKFITKVCVSEKKGKSYQIFDSFSFDTPLNAVNDGQIADVSLLSIELKKQLSAHMVNAKNVIFSVTSSRIAARDVVLPAAKDDMIANMIATNATDYFPIDLADYSIASAILERTQTECRVQVFAVPTAIVMGYIELAEASGLSLEAVDFSGNAQFQVLKGLSDENVDMVVTVEPEFSVVTFMQNKTLLLQRVLPVGGESLVTDYLSAAGDINASFLKTLEHLSDSDKALDASDNSAIQSLVSGIARSLDYFRSSKYAESAVARVILLGSCSHLSGLKQKVSEYIGADTFWAEELEGIAGLANSMNGVSFYLSCLGARVQPLDLLPKEYKTSRSKGNRNAFISGKLGFIVGGVCVIAAILLFSMSYLQYGLNKKELEGIEEQISALQYAEETYNAYLSYQDSDKVLQKFVDEADTPNAYLIDFFEEMEKKMPSEIIVLSASCTEDGVSMNVTVPDYEEAANVLRQFRSFESIDVISVGSISKSSEDTGVSTVSFSISCAYFVPEEETEPVTEETTAEETTEEE